MKLEQAIKQEKDRVREEVKILKKTNGNDVETLNALKEEYNSVIVKGGSDEDIDEVNNRIKEIMKRIERNEDKINALTGDNPITQQLLLDGLKQVLETKSTLEEEVENKYEDLQKLHKQLLDGFADLNSSRVKINNLGTRSNRIIEKLNDQNKEQSNVELYSPLTDNKATEYMNGLLIERSQVFRN